MRPFEPLRPLIEDSNCFRWEPVQPEEFIKVCKELTKPPVLAVFETGLVYQKHVADHVIRIMLSKLFGINFPMLELLVFLSQMDMEQSVCLCRNWIFFCKNQKWQVYRRNRRILKKHKPSACFIDNSDISYPVASEQCTEPNSANSENVAPNKSSLIGEKFGSVSVGKRYPHEPKKNFNFRPILYSGLTVGRWWGLTKSVNVRRLLSKSEAVYQGGFSNF